MVPGAIGGEVASWLLLLGLGAVPGVVAALLWSPVLVAGRVRSLFRRLPPTGSAAVTYPLVAVGLSLPWIAGTGSALLAIGSEDPAAGANALLDVIVPLSAGYVIGLPLVAGVGLPRAGIDWDPTGYGVGTWLLLLVGAAWYAALFAVPLFLVAVILALPA